jgi:p-cumate 2,3-dioxygenase alpha subunit
MSEERPSEAFKTLPFAQKVGGRPLILFVSFEPMIESLVAYLGNAREYLDLMLDFGGEEVEIVHGSQAYSMKANWKLLVENSMDGYHAIPTHQRFFSQYLADIGMDASSWAGPNRIQGIGLALGGHAVIENRARALPITGTAKGELDRIRARAGRTVRPRAGASYRRLQQKRRFENFISFLGPAGFGTPDDVDALEGCQRGFAAWREVSWSDMSRGMGRGQPSSRDELQMRAFWRRWHALMQGLRGASDCSDRPEQRAAAE